MKFDVIVIGGGLAGCAASITLARRGRSVLLVEAGRYPRQKVCGEFVSSEALDVLVDLLGARVGAVFARSPAITRVVFHSFGREAEAPLPRPARSISRDVLDFELWQAAIAAGADARELTRVDAPVRDTAGFRIRTTAGEFVAPVVIDASGRWSRLRPGRVQHASMVGIKGHVRGQFREGAVGLYFFPEGYCGVQSVSHDEVNVCALVHPEAARTLEQVVGLDPDLQRLAQGWHFNQAALTTAPVIPRLPVPLADGILRVGDAAGFIDPFFGDGMSLALRSGVLAARYCDEPEAYRREYLRQFRQAFRAAKIARRVLRGPVPAVWTLLRHAAPAVVSLAYRMR